MMPRQLPNFDTLLINSLIIQQYFDWVVATCKTNTGEENPSYWTNIKSRQEHEVNETKLNQRHDFDLSELMLDPPLAHCLTSRYTTGTLMLLPKLHWALLNSTNAICTGDGKNRFARKLVLAHCLTYM